MSRHGGAKNDFERLLPILKAIPTDKVIEPDRPVGTIVQEAYDLANTAHQYRPHLLAVGVSAELIDGIVARANALSAAQTAGSRQSRGPSYSGEEESTDYADEHRENRRL